MQIHQLNLRYDQEQDRLLLRVNTSTALEIRVWLTRRLVVGVLPVFRRLITEQSAKLESTAMAAGSTVIARDPKLRELLQEFKKDAVLQSSDFATPFKETADDAKATDETVLVNEVAITPLANAHLRVKLTGKVVRSTLNQDLQIELDDRMMHGFLHLLETAFTSSDWASTPVAAQETEATKAIAGAPAPPQYLN